MRNFPTQIQPDLWLNFCCETFKGAKRTHRRRQSQFQSVVMYHCSHQETVIKIATSCLLGLLQKQIHPWCPIDWLVASTWLFTIEQMGMQRSTRTTLNNYHYLTLETIKLRILSEIGVMSQIECVYFLLI